jgi:O-antigen/teichoic acid export membrane protein
MTRMSQGGGSAGRRLSVITVDQLLAGASNVLSSVLAARALGVASFGLFGLTFIAYMMLIGISRGLVSDPLLVHPEDAEKRPGEVIGSQLLLSLAIAAAVIVFGVLTRLWDPTLGSALIVLGICLPLLMLQDLGRYIGFATQRPIQAIVLDAAWLILLIGAVAALFATDARTLTWFVAAWAGSGALAGLLIFQQHGLRAIRLDISWLRRTWSFSWRYLVSYVSTQGAALGASSGVGAVAGARSLGGVQGAALLTRPFTVFQQAAIAANIGEVTRSLRDNRLVRRHVKLTTVVTGTVAALNLVVMLVLPRHIGTIFLGASWHVAHPLLLPTGVQIVCLGILTGPRAGLLGMRQIRKVMVADVLTTGMVVVATFAGVVIDGAKGALWLIALGQAVLAVYWWLTFLAQTRHAETVASATSPPPSPISAVTIANPPV